MKRKKNLLYYFIGFVLINFCCTNANAQNQSKFEPCLNLGIRNVGLMCNYKIQKQVDFNVGVNAPRYSNFSIAMYGGLKFYPFKNSISSKTYAGRPFIGVAYSYSLKTTFSGEDSRTFVNTFNIPANKSLVWEAGYRYDYKPEKMFTNLKTGLGISLSFLYQKGLDDNYNATVKNGSDIDGKIDKINKFMKGGYGFVIGVYFLFERIKK